jgi:hypothetical protein
MGRIAGLTPCQSEDQESRLKIAVGRIVIALGSLHLSMMGAIGMWLWIDPLSFGEAGTANACAIDFASTSIVGGAVPFGSGQKFSIAIYVLFLIPGLNLILPMVFFVGTTILYHTHVSPDNFSAVPARIDLAILSAINVIFLINIETTLPRNRALEVGEPSAFDFGQLIAALLSVGDVLRVVIDSAEKARKSRKALGANVNAQGKVPGLILMSCN